MTAKHLLLTSGQITLPGKLKLRLTLGSDSKPSDVHERLPMDLLAPEAALRAHQSSLLAPVDLLAPVSP